MRGPVIFNDGRGRMYGRLPVRKRLRPVPDHLSALAADRGEVFVWLTRAAPDRSGCSRWPWFQVGERMSAVEALALCIVGEC